MAKKQARKEDKSEHIVQRSKFKGELNIRERKDYTEKQKVIIEKSLDKETKCVMVDGFWGTGKTNLAVLSSLKLLNEKKVDQIIYVRMPIEASKNSRCGFLQGSLDEKMAPYNAPFYDKLSEYLSQPEIQSLTNDSRLHCVPVGFLQGISWNCKAVIVDECSLMNWEELLLILTRCGQFTKLFLIGDTTNQLYLSEKSGFQKLVEYFSDEDSKANGVFTYKLQDEKDIVRSGFVRFVMNKIKEKEERSMFPQ